MKVKDEIGWVICERINKNKSVMVCFDSEDGLAGLCGNVYIYPLKFLATDDCNKLNEAWEAKKFFVEKVLCKVMKND